VLPSIREGMPGALLEAMALGAPIVASDLPQIREVVDQSCARLVAPGSPASLARTLLETLEAKDESAERADQARHRFVERYTIGRVADQMVRFYERALGRE
jgi:glycosyltransferase involved in cell wall biosynthesis